MGQLIALKMTQFEIDKEGIPPAALCEICRLQLLFVRCKQLFKTIAQENHPFRRVLKHLLSMFAVRRQLVISNLF